MVPRSSLDCLIRLSDPFNPTPSGQAAALAAPQAESPCNRIAGTQRQQSVQLPPEGVRLPDIQPLTGLHRLNPPSLRAEGEAPAQQTANQGTVLFASYCLGAGGVNQDHCYLSTTVFGFSSLCKPGFDWRVAFQVEALRRLPAMVSRETPAESALLIPRVTFVKFLWTSLKAPFPAQELYSFSCLCPRRQKHRLLFKLG